MKDKKIPARLWEALAGKGRGRVDIVCV